MNRASTMSCLGAGFLLISCGLIFGFLGTKPPDSSLLGLLVCPSVVLTLLFAIWANRARESAKEEKRHQDLLTVVAATRAPVNVTMATPAKSTQEVRPQLEAAKALIEAKKYKEARALLQTLDNDKAREWLARLDGMKP